MTLLIDLGGLASWYFEVEGWAMAAWGETVQKLSESIYPVKGVFIANDYKC